METLYRKVAVSERLPNDSGYYFGIDSLGHREYPYFDKEENKWGSILGTTHWLEEIPDNSHQLEKLEAEKAELQQWKDSALEVMNQINLQEVGKVLNLQLGSSVSEQILPAIKKLVADKAELLEALEKIYRIGNKPYRNTRNEEIEINQIAYALIQKMKQ